MPAVVNQTLEPFPIRRNRLIDRKVLSLNSLEHVRIAKVPQLSRNMLRIGRFWRDEYEVMLLCSTAVADAQEWGFARA